MKRSEKLRKQREGAADELVFRRDSVEIAAVGASGLYFRHHLATKWIPEFIQWLERLNEEVTDEKKE